MNNVWQSGYATPTPNALAALTISEDGSEIVYRYRRGGAQGPYGFRWADNRIRSLIGANWQELTDANVMRVTAFSVTEEPIATEVMPCPRVCADGTTACWPTLSVRTSSRTPASSTSSTTIFRAAVSSRETSSARRSAMPAKKSKTTTATKNPKPTPSTPSSA